LHESSQLHCRSGEQVRQVTAEEVVQTLRRQSKGFQKTSSVFRGVTKHQKGKWEGASARWSARSTSEC